MSNFPVPARLALSLPVALSVALVATVGGMTMGAAPAAAQWFGFYEPAPRPYYRSYRSSRPRVERQVRRERSLVREAAREQRKAAPQERETAADTPETARGGSQKMVFAVVSLADQHINVYGEEGLLARSRVSSGQAGFRTPTGIFGILEKQRDHESNIYDGAEMPFMQRLTWSGVALHQGIVPRYPASHGCIRLPAAFAARLWTMTIVGARVVVSTHDIKPAIISHARLPSARMATADMLGIEPEAKATDGASNNEPATQAVRVAAAGGGAVMPDASRRYNPVEVAALLKSHAQAQVREANRTAERGRGEARTASNAANEAADAVRDARSDLDDARAENAPAEKIAEIERRLAGAQALDAERGPKALEAALVVRDAERSAEAAREAVSDASRRSSPLSVLISAKEGLVVIKQGRKPVYEAPFTLRDADVPLGTHLFVATAPSGDNGELRWSALSVPGDAQPRPNKHKPGQDDQPAAAAPPAASTATEALDRITLTPETEKKLAELIWVGGSIIVTDRGVSPDYGEHTDMVVAIP